MGREGAREGRERERTSCHADVCPNLSLKSLHQCEEAQKVIPVERKDLRRKEEGLLSSRTLQSSGDSKRLRVVTLSMTRYT